MKKKKKKRTGRNREAERDREEHNERKGERERRGKRISSLLASGERGELTSGVVERGTGE